MTISELFTVLGAGAGIMVLALMAATPLLLALPLPERADAPAVRIPAPRRASDLRPLRTHVDAA